MTAEGAPARTAPAPRPRRERSSFPQFLREVRAELRKVAWPTRDEVRSYSILVLITVVVFTTAVTVLDFIFGTGALWLFDR
jgi:preprotein translocase subunit SecE